MITVTGKDVLGLQPCGQEGQKGGLESGCSDLKSVLKKGIDNYSGVPFSRHVYKKGAEKQSAWVYQKQV